MEVGPLLAVPPGERYKLVQSFLDKYREMTLEALLSYVPEREPRKYLYDLVSDYPVRGGKGFRPSLCLASCAAFGGDPLDALRSAVSLELFHNAFLVHDDVEDGSEDRRGRPTMHAQFGIPIAVNVGDAMNVLSIRPLMDNLKHLGERLAWQVFTEIEHMVRESVEGQAMELGWVHENVIDLQPQDYLRMILKKTCWYTCIHPVRIGAIIGSDGEIDPDEFNRFGYYMGASFQIQDDILNLYGEHKRYGKEIGGDIWEGKRTLILIHALNTCTPRQRERMRRFLSQPRVERSADDVRWVYRVFQECGSLEYSRSVARYLAGAALQEFADSFSGAKETPEKRFLEQIILYMIERDL
ncbi:MAG TPA: polyprenyl synthetase family protein [Myxococcaceae bacterium]